MQPIFIISEVAKFLGEELFNDIYKTISEDIYPIQIP